MSIATRQRRQEERELIAIYPRSVPWLAERFGLSERTIRNDLLWLQTHPPRLPVQRFALVLYGVGDWWPYRERL